MGEVTVLFADRWVLVAEKPSGLPTQASRKQPNGLFERLKTKHEYVGLHHRLDQPASGLILFALDPSVNPALSAAFQGKRIQRTYCAVVAGRVSEAIWDPPVDGKPARTAVFPIGHGSGMSAVELTLDTGRKHQIRLHAASADHPVLGDRRYGKQWGAAWPRLALHARRLSFKHPKTGENVVVTSPIPMDMAELWSLAGGIDPVD